MNRNTFFKTAIGLLAFKEVAEHIATPRVTMKWGYLDGKQEYPYIVESDDVPGVDRPVFKLVLNSKEFRLITISPSTPTLEGDGWKYNVTYI